jgi:hypothetical protein
MLDEYKLMAAGAESSKNPLINGLLQEVKAYNAIVSPVNPKPKADQLLRICQIGSWYCTSKPPQPEKINKPGGGKNKLRWAAVKDLLEQIGNEVVALNLRMLTGPADFKTISAHKPSYWLELADPQHRAGYILAPQFATWVTKVQPIGQKKSFWDSIGTDYSGMDLSIVVKYYPELKGQAAEYMEDRGLLRFNADGKLCDLSDTPWDTFNTETHFSGKGWGIFVVSPTGHIFGGTHEAGKHHHSSFLGGGAVMAAGEMACFDGIPRIITAKSGHYRPSAQNIRNFLNKYPQIPGDSLVLPGFGKPKFYTVQDFRANGEAGTVLTKQQVTDFLWKYPQAASSAAPNNTAGFREVWNLL